MTAFTGLLRLDAGDSVEARIRLAGRRLEVLVPGSEVISWPTGRVGLLPVDDETFELSTSSETLLFEPEDPSGFRESVVDGMRGRRRTFAKRGQPTQSHHEHVFTEYRLDGLVRKVCDSCGHVVIELIDRAPNPHDHLQSHAARQRRAVVR